MAFQNCQNTQLKNMNNDFNSETAITVNDE